MSEVPPPDLTIVLIGKTGVGKSASGNTILQNTAAFKSELSFKPVTTKISEQRGTVLKKQILVVDTPGVLNSKATKKKIKKHCQELLQSSRPCLFLVVISVGRFTKEDRKAAKAAKKVLGPQGVEKSYLLFTGGHMLEGRTLEDFISKDKVNVGDEGGDEGMLSEVFSQFAPRFHLFDNKKKDEEQVWELLKKSGNLTPQDQADSPDDGGQQHGTIDMSRTDAGQPTSPEYVLFKDRILPIVKSTIVGRLGAAIANSVTLPDIFQAAQTVLSSVNSLEEGVGTVRKIVNIIVLLSFMKNMLKTGDLDMTGISFILSGLEDVLNLVGKLLKAVLNWQVQP